MGTSAYVLTYWHHALTFVSVLHQCSCWHNPWSTGSDSMRICVHLSHLWSLRLTHPNPHRSRTDQCRCAVALILNVFTKRRIQWDCSFCIQLVVNYNHELLDRSSSVLCSHPGLFFTLCLCFAALVCPDHLATICHKRAGERSQSAVISSSRNVWNSSCGVGVGPTWDQRPLDTHIMDWMPHMLSTDLTSLLFILPLTWIKLLWRGAFLSLNAQLGDVPARRMSTEPKRSSGRCPFKQQQWTLSAVRLSARHLAVVRDPSWHGVFHFAMLAVLAGTWAWSHYSCRSKVIRPLTQLYRILRETLRYFKVQCAVFRDF